MAMEEFKAPALPYPGMEYNREYFNQLINVLRIYFNQLDSDAANRAYSYRADYFYGGQFIGDGFGFKLPHIAASDSGAQYATGNNTPTLATWDTLNSEYLWTLNSPGSATAQVAGVYKITYSLQFANTDNAAHDATVWLRNNGTDVAKSTTQFTLMARKSTGVPALNVGYSEVVFEVAVGDEIELYWATEQAYDAGVQDGVYIFSDTAQTSPYARPAIPSAIGSISFVSAVP